MVYWVYYGLWSCFPTVSLVLKPCSMQPPRPKGVTTPPPTANCNCKHFSQHTAAVRLPSVCSPIDSNLSLEIAIQWALLSTCMGPFPTALQQTVKHATPFRPITHIKGSAGTNPLGLCLHGGLPTWTWPTIAHGQNLRCSHHHSQNRTCHRDRDRYAVACNAVQLPVLSHWQSVDSIYMLSSVSQSLTVRESQVKSSSQNINESAFRIQHSSAFMTAALQSTIASVCKQASGIVTLLLLLSKDRSPAVLKEAGKPCPWSSSLPKINPYYEWASPAWLGMTAASLPLAANEHVVTTWLLCHYVTCYLIWRWFNDRMIRWCKIK